MGNTAAVQSGQGGSFTPDQIASMCSAYLNRQEALVGQLKEIITHQRATLNALADDDEYKSDDEQDAAHDPSHDRIEDDLKQLTARAYKSASGERKGPLSPGAAPFEAPDFTGEGEEDEGRGFASVKPWLGAINSPTDWTKPADLDEKPPVSLKLKHVYGYRARTCRSNVAFIDSKHVAFPAAGLGIVHDVSSSSQRFARHHDDDIVCLAYHPGRRLVATGQQGKDAAISLWSVDEPEKAVAVIKNAHKRAVVSVAFSQDGKRIASVGLDDDHTVRVHDVDSGALIASSKGGSALLVQVAFNTTAGADPNAEFVTVGIRTVSFWTLTGSTLASKRGLLGKKGESQPFLAVAFTDQHTVIGTASGQMYIFSDNKLKGSVAAHSGALQALATVKDTSGGGEVKMSVVTGGADGRVTVWDASSLGSAPKRTSTVDVNSVDPTPLGSSGVRAIGAPVEGDTVAVGVDVGSVYMVNLNTRETSVAVVGHFGNLKANAQYGETWGLAAHPTRQMAVSAGDDCSVRQWDLQTRKQVRRLELDAAVLSVDYHPSGSYVAVGMVDGRVALIAAPPVEKDQWTKIAEIRKAKGRVMVVKFSPDGKILAAGTADNTILFFNVGADGGVSFRAGARGPSSAVRHIDWAADGSVVCVDTQAYELLYYTPDGVAKTSTKDFRDTEMKTQSCVLGWSVQGIWPKDADGTDVNIVSKARTQPILASGDDFGLVKLFRWPCLGSGLDKRGKLSSRPEAVVGEGHSEHVTNVVWGVNDEYLLSSGGADNCIFQWVVEKQ